MLSSTAQRIIDRLSKPTKRGKQKRIGPSEVGILCERCLAEKMLGIHKEPETVTLPPIIGTAVHAYLEQLMDNDIGVLKEVPVVVGNIDGYGEIKGTMDYFDIKNNHALDYKVVGKKKLADYKRALKVTKKGVVFDNDSPVVSTLKQYWIQLSLYSRGMELLGHDVKQMSLLMIPRDDTTTDVRLAIEEIVFPYDREVALKALERASQIYKWAQEHRDSLDDLVSDPNCYYCKYTRWKELDF